jgi:hypothetical protein
MWYKKDIYEAWSGLVNALLWQVWQIAMAVIVIVESEIR